MAEITKDKQLQYAVDFIADIADEHPIEPMANEINMCRFCLSTWAEDTYDKYLKNVEILREDPEKLLDGWRKLAHEHHEEDCLWVKANYWIGVLRPKGKDE